MAGGRCRGGGARVPALLPRRRRRQRLETGLRRRGAASRRAASSPPPRAAALLRGRDAALVGAQPPQPAGPLHRLLRAAPPRQPQAPRPLHRAALRPAAGAGDGGPRPLPRRASKGSGSPAGSRAATSSPFPDRRGIDDGALAGRKLELVWVDDPVDAFFLQVQGSGRIRLGGRARCAWATPPRTATPTPRSARS